MRLVLQKLERNEGRGPPYLVDKSWMVETDEIPDNEEEMRDWIFFKIKNKMGKFEGGFYRVVTYVSGRFKSEIFKGKISHYRF